MAWYTSRKIRMDKTILSVEGESPWNALAFEHGLLGEHARWWLNRIRDDEHRRAMRQAWMFWRPIEYPPRSSYLYMRPYEPPTVAERAGGRLLAWWIVLLLLRKR